MEQLSDLIYYVICHYNGMHHTQVLECLWPMITAFSNYNNKQIQLNSLKTMTHIVDLHCDYVRVFMCDDISSLIIKLAKSQHPEIIDITLKLILKVAIKA